MEHSIIETGNSEVVVVLLNKDMPVIGCGMRKAERSEGP